MGPFSSYVDILIIAAIEEERFMFDKILTSPNDETKRLSNNRTIRFTEKDNLKIAITDLKGMGNVWACDATLNSIEQCNPRCVIMIGVAGGKKGYFSRGDVGIGVGIGYTTFSKIADDSLSNYLNVRNEDLIEKVIEKLQSLTKATKKEIELRKIVDQIKTLGLKGEKSILDYLERKKSRLFESELTKFKEMLKSETTQTKNEIIEKVKSHGLDLNTLSIMQIDTRWTKRIEIPELFCNTAKTIIASNTQWKNNSKQWFNQYKAEFVRDMNKKKEKESDKYPRQSTFEKRLPIARETVIGSGDAIVASEEFKLSIERLFKQQPSDKRKTGENLPVSMFEMESFGFSKACEARKVIFGIVKGISDYAGGDKTDKSTAKDQYRLAAISSATAFVHEMFSDRDFVRRVKSHEPSSWSHSVCNWTVKTEIGSYQSCKEAEESKSEKSFFFGERPCTSPTFLMADMGNKIIKNALYEDIAAKTYSTCISKAILEKDNQVLLIFPYSVRDLLAFFLNSDNSAWKKNIREIERLSNSLDTNTSSDAIRKLCDLSIMLGKTAQKHYEHFKKSDEICLSKIASGARFEDISQTICRVVYFQEEDKKSIGKNPAVLIHIAMCGLCVPMLLANENIADKFFADEATFIRKPYPGSKIDENNCVTQCLKYADRSKLLLVIGQCEKLADRVEDGKIFGLAKDVSKEILSWKENEGQLTNDLARYKVFPSQNILKKYHYTWENFIDPKMINDSNRETFKRYFNRLEELEEEVD